MLPTAPERERAIGIVRSDDELCRSVRPALQPPQHTIEDRLAAVLRLEQLGASIMLVEYELRSERPQQESDQEERVGRVRGVQHVDAALNREAQGPPRRRDERETGLSELTQDAAQARPWPITKNRDA